MPPLPSRRVALFARKLAGWRGCPSWQGAQLPCVCQGKWVRANGSSFRVKTRCQPALLPLWCNPGAAPVEPNEKNAALKAQALDGRAAFEAEAPLDTDKELVAHVPIGLQDLLAAGMADHAGGVEGGPIF